MISEITSVVIRKRCLNDSYIHWNGWEKNRTEKIGTFIKILKSSNKNSAIYLYKLQVIISKERNDLYITISHIANLSHLGVDIFKHGWFTRIVFSRTKVLSPIFSTYFTSILGRVKWDCPQAHPALWWKAAYNSNRAINFCPTEKSMCNLFSSMNTAIWPFSSISSS